MLVSIWQCDLLFSFYSHVLFTLFLGLSFIPEIVAISGICSTLRSSSGIKLDLLPLAWVYRIATNEALRLLNRYRDDRVSLNDSVDELDSLIADEYVDYSDLEVVKLQKAILTLPTKQQLAFNLRYYDDLGYDEIAGIIGSTADGVKSSYHIAKDKIIKYMNSNN